MSKFGVKPLVRGLIGGAVGLTAVIGSMQAAIASTEQSKPLKNKLFI